MTEHINLSIKGRNANCKCTQKLSRLLKTYVVCWEVSSQILIHSVIRDFRHLNLYQEMQAGAITSQPAF